MPRENMSTANYAAVIADLRARRDELDRVINLLDAIAQINQHSQAPIVTTLVAGPMSSDQTILAHTDIKPSNVMGIGERCMAIVRDHGKGQPMSTRQVTDALLATGFTLNTKSPPNNVWSALSHRAKVSKDVERVGNSWRYVGFPKKRETAESAVSGAMNGAPAIFPPTTEN